MVFRVGECASVAALQTVGVPYTDEQIAEAPAALAAQQKQIVDSLASAKIAADPDADVIALIAYLQRLGKDGQAAVAASEAAAKGSTP